MSTILSPNSVSALKSVLTFTKTFAIEVLKISEAGAVGIDSTPTIAVFATPPTTYDGPELFLNRLKTLDARIGNGQVEVVDGKNGVPALLSIKRGKTTVDFRLAATSQGKRLPATFKGAFAYNLEITRTDLKEILQGAQNLGAKHLMFQNTKDQLQIIGSNEGESFTYTLDTISPESFGFNYAVDHIQTIERHLPGTSSFVGKLTPRGQMMVELTSQSLTANIFLLDIKNR